MIFSNGRKSGNFRQFSVETEFPFTAEFPREPLVKVFFKIFNFLNVSVKNNEITKKKFLAKFFSEKLLARFFSESFARNSLYK